MVTLRPRPPKSPKKKQQDPKTRRSSSTDQSRLPIQCRRPSSTTQESGLAVGLRFHPTDLELVDYYLQSRCAMGDKFHSDFVTECPEFFSEDEPWVIWHLYGGDDSDDEKALYFFTHRKRLSLTAKRFDRKVGSGTWSGQFRRKIKDDGVVIGIKREFRYEGGYDEDHNKAWLMQEYHLVGDDSDLVLCALRKSPRKAPPTTSYQIRVGDEKKKTIMVQPKAKRQRKEKSHDQEEDGSSVDELNVEQRSSCVDQPKVEEMDFELDQDHPLLQGLLPLQFHDDQDCYIPELVVDYQPDFSSIDELLALNSACYDSNNFSFVSNDDNHGQVAHFQEESGKFLEPESGSSWISCSMTEMISADLIRPHEFFQVAGLNETGLKMEHHSVHSL